MKTLVIIGSGFSGAVTAIEFLRRRGGIVRLVLINRSGTMARGLAYGTSSDGHLLNIPAGNMSAFVDEPNSFLTYCCDRGFEAFGHSFMPRRLYGDYLQSVLEAQIRLHGPTVEQIVGEVVRVDVGERKILILDSGLEIIADHVVLALGNFTPRLPIPLAACDQLDQVEVDPWKVELEKLNPLGSVLLLGSGLTALDMLVSLKLYDHRGPVYMLSRRGLLPLAHRLSHIPVELLDDPGDRLLAGLPTALCYCKELRRCIAEHEHRGGDWRDIIAALRRNTASLWKRLPVSERKRFLRHLQPIWDVHRHRVAPPTYELFRSALESGQLKTIAGRLEKVNPEDEVIQVDMRTRKDQAFLRFQVSMIINCTGPNSDLNFVSDPLIQQLVRDGLLVRDSHGLGLNVSPDLEVLDRSHEKVSWLSYIGPMLKASYWEATAVPELRQRAQALAERLARIL
jgi:uncharacterized NAD(P)/FAD-binding protein YdhS